VRRFDMSTAAFAKAPREGLIPQMVLVPPALSGLYLKIPCPPTPTMFYWGIHLVVTQL